MEVKYLSVPWKQIRKTTGGRQLNDLFRAVGMILLGWVRAPEAWTSRRDPGVYFPGEFEKSSCCHCTFTAF